MLNKKPSRAVRNAPYDLSEVLRDAPSGAWVALSSDRSRIVGTGDSASAAAYQAQLKKESNPVLIKMPLSGEEIAAGVR